MTLPIPFGACIDCEKGTHTIEGAKHCAEFEAEVRKKMAESDVTVTVGLNIERDKTIRELQTSLPWTIRYSRDYRANPQPHKDFTHALLHVVKAVGKLQGLADDMDHDREVADNPKLRDEYGKYVADLVVCALRAANVFPGGVLDLQKAVQERIVAKNALPGSPIWVPQEPINAELASQPRQPIADDRKRWPVGAGTVAPEPPRIEREIGAPFHKFKVVQAMRNDLPLTVIPVVDSWHPGEIMEAVIAVNPTATGFREIKQ